MILSLNAQSFTSTFGAFTGAVGALGVVLMYFLNRSKQTVDSKKIHTEIEAISVQAAEGAVGIQAGIISAQRAEIERLKDELKHQGERLDTITLRWANTEDENRRNRTTIEGLRQQLEGLEQRITDLQNQQQRRRP